MKEVPDHPNYLVSPDGYVVNRKTGRVLKEDITNRGYHRITVCKNNKVKRYTLHRLVAELFIPNPLGKETVNHKSGDKRDNSVENLEWMTQEENQNHAKETGLCPKGTAMKTSKYSEETIHEVCRLIQEGWTRKPVLDKAGITKSTFDDIRRRKSWKFISCNYNW